MTQTHPLASTRVLGSALPVLQPDDAARRLFLFALRQMGAHGLNDASAAHAMVTAFGKDFRRPLVLLRTLMHDMSQAATNPIQIAPWCCCRMTGAEATLIEVMARIKDEPDAAGLLLADLIGVREAGGVAAIAHLVATAFGDLGLPLG